MNKRFFLTLFLYFSLFSLRAEEFYDGTIDSPSPAEEGLPPYSSALNPGLPVATGNAAVNQMDDRLSQLENQVRDLRGKLEELQHQLKVLPQTISKPLAEESKDQISRLFSQEEEKKNRQDKANRLMSESQSPEDEGSTLKGGPALQRYEEAQEYLAQQSYPEAERALKDIIHHYPADPLVINATYWLGETYYVQKDYAHAAVAFGDAYKAYRKLDKSTDVKNREARKISFAKAPEALVKLAICLKALGKDAQACVTLDQLRSEFPRLPQNVKRLAETAEQSLQQCKKTSKD